MAFSLNTVNSFVKISQHLEVEEIINWSFHLGEVGAFSKNFEILRKFVDSYTLYSENISWKYPPKTGVLSAR